MDRETQDQYLVLLQAKDMGGHLGGLSGTTTVTVKLSDVNDNPPRFTQSECYSIGAAVGWGVERRREGSQWVRKGLRLCAFHLSGFTAERKQTLGVPAATGSLCLQAAAFADLSDPQALSGFSQPQSGGGDSRRAAKCLIKHSGRDFSASAAIYQLLPIPAVPSDYGT